MTGLSAISHRRVQKELLYTVMVRNQLPEQAVKLQLSFSWKVKIILLLIINLTNIN